MRKNKVYLRATIITIALIICNQLFIQYWLFQKREDALLINRGGRQRMLSQRIMLQAMLYHENPEVSNYQALQLSIKEWDSSQQFLIDRLEESADIYHEKQTRDRLTELSSFIKGAQSLTANDRINDEQLEALGANQEQFLREMDLLVSVMQKDSDQKLKMIVAIEIIFALLSLFLVYYEITFVFQKINDRLVRKNEDLSESNELLEQYAHLASHDLRAPIQNIINFSDLLKRRLDHKLGSDEKEFLKYIIEASHRLKLTTSDLLKVATIQHQELDYQWCSPKHILEEVLEDLDEEIVTSQAQINIEPFPEIIKVDQHTIHLVFQNLIANSLKFTKEGQAPQITVSYDETANEHIFIFRDEGIGIAKEDQAHVFKIFRRINEEGQYEGTGMGLAICQRMIRRLHGNIEVVSQLGQGSTFKIELPKESIHSGLLGTF